MNGWHNVTRNQPCPCCGRPDWCSVSDDGVWAVCRRQREGAQREGVDSAGMEYFVHQLAATPGPRWTPPPTAVRAGPADLDRVYRALLAQLPLAAAHRQGLEARGLNPAAIRAGGYRSLPVPGRGAMARALAERFEPHVLMAVPGIQERERAGRRWLTVGGAAGLVVPVRDVESRVVALKVRADNPLDPANRYSYLSSTRYGGPSPGTPVHVPVGGTRSRVVRVTEGELKADVATHLSATTTVSVAGVGTWRSALPVLERLEPESVLVAFDADWRSNDHVRATLVDAAAALGSRYAGGIEVWRPSAGKGIDDVLVAGSGTRVIPFDERERLVERSREPGRDRTLTR